MKKLFVLIISLAFVSIANAQRTVATLTHNGENKEFYNSKAFINAMAEAVDGDLITLSVGSFEAPTINHGVKIRGAGYDGGQFTEVRNDLKVQCEETTGILDIEGVYISGRMKIETNEIAEVRLRRCKVLNMNIETAVSTNLVHCIVSREMLVSGACAVTCMNSIIFDPLNSNYAAAYIDFNYCVVRRRSGKLSEGMNFLNTVYANQDSDYYGERYDYIPASSSADRCVSVGTTRYGNLNNTFRLMQGTNYGFVANLNDVFNTLPDVASYQPDDDYALSETAQTTFTDAAGGQIGIYGGVAPFTKNLSYVVFSQFDVDPQAEDGNIGVKITIKNPE